VLRITAHVSNVNYIFNFILNYFLGPRNAAHLRMKKAENVGFMKNKLKFSFRKKEKSTQKIWVLLRIFKLLEENRLYLELKQFAVQLTLRNQKIKSELHQRRQFEL
jgi:hypothetical protein